MESQVLEFARYAFDCTIRLVIFMKYMSPMDFAVQAVSNSKSKGRTVQPHIRVADFVFNGYESTSTSSDSPSGTTESSDTTPMTAQSGNTATS